MEAQAGTGGGPEEGEASALPAGPTAKAGYWPSWWQKFRNDFRTARGASANDGLRAPEFQLPDWARGPGAGTEVVLEAARRRHQDAEARIDKAEARAARLVQTALSLLAITFVSAGYQAHRLRSAHAPLYTWIAGVPIAAAIFCLAMSAVEAVGVDRVGYVQPAEPGPAASLVDEAAQRRNLVGQEALAALMANWTARHKVNEGLQARAWMTRGVTALAMSGISLIVIWAVVAGPTRATTRNPPPQSHRPASQGRP